MRIAPTEIEKKPTAKSVADVIKKIINDNWAKDISDEEAKNMIDKILSDKENFTKVFRGDEMVKVFEKTMGDRRLKKFNELRKG